MATLEDKLMGEKLEYYCSSSEGEDNGEDGEEDGKRSGGASSKQGAQGFTDPDVCPAPPPATGYRQTSTNTGPKGVVQDWQLFKQQQAERRANQDRERIEIAKKMTMTTATTKEEDERKRQEAIDAELEELLDEDFLAQFQKQRIAEMMQQCNVQKFGKVEDLPTHEAFLECIERTHKKVMIVIHIFDRAVAACVKLNECLDTIAEEYPSVKFAKISHSVAGMSRDFRNKGLPALLVYQDQALVFNFVRLTDELSDDFFASDVESFLHDNCILHQKPLFK